MEEAPPSLRCFQESHSSELFNDDGLQTVTSREQRKVERSIQEVYSVYQQIHTSPQPALLREQHYHYLKKGLRHLSDAYECLDASRPWLCYWILHSLELLEEPVPAAVASDVCQFLARCQAPTGGFGGGPGQQAHLAPTYAAVNALCILGTEEAYNVINRETLLDFLYSVKQPDGSFVMHIGGEVDVSCQNWEGGLGGVPGLEAHGGYTFCGTAALVILGKEHMLDLKALLRWVTSRQMRFEGGFQGRCNKLVDGCYSFWQAGLLPLLHRALFKEGDSTLSVSSWMFERKALQEYILLCCQNPGGGLLDKPGKSRDFYHTSYCLSGLSVAQHFGNKDLHNELILGRDENKLAPTHPVYNICPEKVARAVEYFHRLPVPIPTGATASAMDQS
ncbi:protein farnesyltransferase subunit beta isoform X1 [Danio rerio]|uniref:Protein farnesyltransferase subunit beta n=1 Tax=Danio rerio TaxID=7955 RepID=A0A8M9PP61_DANRE|nr:protein farnesyltransferase subunit beta isoform X1 [Danio rerio]|eukprot:XP_021324041.1 protein farnesyltransferase subunit beta isoform X1 [Danio rerio]